MQQDEISHFSLSAWMTLITSFAKNDLMLPRLVLKHVYFFLMLESQQKKADGKLVILKINVNTVHSIVLPKPLLMKIKSKKEIMKAIK